MPYSSTKEKFIRNNIKFPGYNKPVKTPNAKKPYAVLAKENNKIKLVRFGHKASNSIRNDSAERRKRYRARQSCNKAKTKLSAGFWSCKAWEANRNEQKWPVAKNI